MVIESTYPINEEALVNLKVLSSEYDILTSMEVDYNNSKVKNFLEGDIDNKCRFCNKQVPDVKFKTVAHAIPEFTGNKSLIAKFECDSCNRYFSHFENEFANFMLPYNALGGVKKKGNKSAKYKQDIVVYHNKEDSIHIDDFPNEISPYTKEIDLVLNVPTYIPDFIYRCLMKIGLTLIPETLIGKYNEALTWLMNTSSNTVFPASMIFSIFPFSNPSDKIRCIILFRKDFVSRPIPETILIFSYQNFAFQTFFPNSIFENKETLLPFPSIIPSTLDLNLDLALRKSIKVIDLSRKVKVKDEKADFIIKSLD